MYKLTVTKKQLSLISRACELMSRIQAGQWREMLEHLPLAKDIDYELYHYDVDFITELLSKYMIDNIDGWHSSFGVGCKKITEDHDILYDLYCVIRNKLSWESAVEKGIVENEDSPRKFPEMMFVSYDEPHNWGSEPLAILEKDVYL